MCGFLHLLWIGFSCSKQNLIICWRRSEHTRHLDNFFWQFLSFFTEEKQKWNKKEMFCNSLFRAIQQFQRLVHFDDAPASLNPNKNASTSISKRREWNRSEEEKQNAAIQCEAANNAIVRKIKSKVNWYSLLLLARLPDSKSTSTRRYSHEILLFALRSRLLFNAK